MENSVDSRLSGIKAVDEHPATCRQLAVAPLRKKGIRMQRPKEGKLVKQLDIIENNLRRKRIRAPKSYVSSIKMSQVLVSLGENARHQATTLAPRAARNISLASSSE